MQLANANQATVLVGCVGLGFLAMAIKGTKGNVDYVGRSESEVCPRCDNKGTLEIYNKKTEDIASGLFSDIKVTTTTPMIKCMNTKCSYERKYKLHQQETKHRERREAVMAMDTSSSLEDGLGDSPANLESHGTISPTTYGNGAARSSLEEKAWQVADALQEQERRQELRHKKLDKKGKLQVHPESQRLQADFGTCPDCGQSIKFKRWIRQHQAGPFSPPVVVESISLAECNKSKTCGYIARLNAHKKNVRQAVPRGAVATDVETQPKNDNDNEMESLLTSSVEMV